MGIRRLDPAGVAGPASDYSLLSLVAAGVPLVWIAGQTGRHPEGEMPATALHQTMAAFENIATLLAEAGSSPSQIVHLRTYLVGRSSMDGFISGRRQVFEQWYGAEPPPTSTLAFVEGLADPRALVEIEAVAVR